MRRTRAKRLVVVVGGLWAVLVSGYLISAALDLRAGQQAAQAARAHTTAEVVAGAPIADLRKARHRLARAGRQLRAPPLAPVRLIPGVGRQLQSLASLSRSAATVAAAGANGLARAVRILDETGAGKGSQAVKARGIGEVADRALIELRDLDLGPRSGLIGPVASARRDFGEDLDSLRTALRRGGAGARAAATLFQGPRRYLVLAANNAEMRAGSGMFLSVGVLETGEGALRLSDMQSVTSVPVPPGAVPLTGDLGDRWGWLHPSEDFRNLMLSPRFDVQAQLAARMWEATGHPPVDGVLALDPVALQGLMRATGPVVVDGQQIHADNVVTELLHDQYLRFGSDDPEIAARREGLGRLARAAFDVLDGGEWSVADLASGLLPVVDGRHLLAWSGRASDQADWAAAEVDGALRRSSLLVAVSSRSGNKLDQYLPVSGVVTVDQDARDSLVTVRLKVANTAPVGEPKIITGATDGSGVGEGVYSGIVAVSLPAAARGGRIDGVDQLIAAGPDGPTRVVATEVVLERGKTRTFLVRFRLPGREGFLRVEPSARVPAIAWRSSGERWLDTRAHVVRWERR